jgi:hypothetical protein
MNALAILEILDKYPLLGFCSALRVRVREWRAETGALIDALSVINLGVDDVNFLFLCRNRTNFHMIQVDLLISGPESAVIANERFTRGVKRIITPRTFDGLPLYLCCFHFASRVP